MILEYNQNINSHHFSRFLAVLTSFKVIMNVLRSSIHEIIQTILQYQQEMVSPIILSILRSINGVHTLIIIIYTAVESRAFILSYSGG